MTGYNHYPWCMCGWCYKSGTNGYSSRIPHSVLEKASALRKLTDFGVTRSWTACFVSPTACPECGEKVFYYQNTHGSRVFFNELGGGWPKHECTDRRRRLPKPKPSELGSLSIRSTGEVREIVELLHQADHNPAIQYKEQYHAEPEILFEVVKVARNGFENSVEAIQIAPQYDTPSYFIFTSAKFSPAPREYFSTHGDKISFFDWISDTGRRFNYRSLTVTSRKVIWLLLEQLRL